MAEKRAKFEVYQSAGLWRWRLRARNGRIVASGQAFTPRRAGALRAVATVIDASDEAAGEPIKGAE